MPRSDAINLIVGDGRKLLRRPINKDFNPRYVSWLVRHGGGSIMVWGCFSGIRLGQFIKFTEF